MTGTGRGHRSCLTDTNFLLIKDLFSLQVIRWHLHMDIIKKGIWELLRPEKISITHVLVTLLTGNAWLFNGVKDLLDISVRYHQEISVVILEICITHV